ncbi:MAG: type II secretion system F family protein [Longimicrobiales bacterium]|nr:type II secretion system F family protein [Longimicrobiales bacterium]
MNNPIWIPAILVFLAVGFGTVALSMVSEVVRRLWRQRTVAKRVKPVLSGLQARRGGVRQDLVRQGRGDPAFLGALIPGLPRLETLIEQSRLDFGVGTFLILVIGLGLSLGLSAYLLTGAVLWGAFAASVGVSLPFFFASVRRKRRFRQFEEEFPEGIDLLTRAIRAGHPLSSALGMVGDEGPPEVSREFRQVFEEQRFGIPFEEALLGMVDRTDMMDVRIFAIAVLVQREVGGNLAETLANLAETIRRRFYLRRQLRTYTAQGRLTGYTLLALPLVMGVVLSLLAPGYVPTLFTNVFGQILVASALLLQLIGGLWIRNIIKFDF